MEQKKRMTIKEWWDAVGTENVKAVIEDVGTTFKYLRQMRYQVKRPGVDLAWAIIDACHRLTPGFAPDFEVMLGPVKKSTGSGGFDKKIKPSPEYLAAQANRSVAG